MTAAGETSYVSPAPSLADAQHIELGQEVENLDRLDVAAEAIRFVGSNREDVDIYNCAKGRFFFFTLSVTANTARASPLFRFSFKHWI
jgi:hypothetical protein